ncbi:hypothetical protein [Cupriavidus respiraculi]|nr:hypothetical protein [Cupriavidus respiraculi]
MLDTPALRDRLTVQMARASGGIDGALAGAEQTLAHFERGLRLAG